MNKSTSINFKPSWSTKPKKEEGMHLNSISPVKSAVHMNTELICHISFFLMEDHISSLEAELLYQCLISWVVEVYTRLPQINLYRHVFWSVGGLCWHWGSSKE